jgi:hypothetical protein
MKSFTKKEKMPRLVKLHEEGEIPSFGEASRRGVVSQPLVKLHEEG